MSVETGLTAAVILGRRWTSPGSFTGESAIGALPSAAVRNAASTGRNSSMRLEPTVRQPSDDEEHDAHGPNRIREFLRARGARTLSRKTLSFWKMLLDLESEPCFETSSLRRSRPFWNY